MRKGILFLLIFLLLLAGPTAVRYLNFYDLNPTERGAPPPYDPAKIAPVSTPASSDFVDEPMMGEGLVLLDVAHQNNFTMEDIAYLDGRLAARGFELLPYEEGDLGLALRTVSAFVVISPLSAFSMEETLAVSRFVQQGGRLLLVGDPTRFNIIFDEEDFFAEPVLETDLIPLNSLSNEFDIVFNGDYLYNTVENEGNFRNIILRQEGFAEDNLVDGLEKLAFYSSHSLRVGPSGNALITADDNTWSSATDRAGDLVLAATSREGRVLALGDMHFLLQPYFTVFDNSAFIARIADFLTGPQDRQLTLADFPYFYRQPAGLVYTGAPELGPDAFDEIIALQDAFRRVDRALSLTAVPSADSDVLYLGLYNQAEDVAEILTSAGISLTIDPPIVANIEINQESLAEDENGEEGPAVEETAVRLIQSNLGSVQMSGTSLILLDEEDGQRRVVVLAASGEGLGNAVNRLLDLIPLNAVDTLSDCLLQNNLALCPSNVFEEAVEFELESGGTTAVSEEDETTPIDEGEGDFGGPVEPDINLDDVILKGAISAGQTVTGTLAEDEIHSWVFTEGPATLDIFLSGADLDGVVEVYGPNLELLYSADNSVTGEDEALFAIEIPDDAAYTIVVRDFFGRSADYVLEVLPSGG